MIRGWDNKGAMFIGLVRGPLVDRLFAGERVCLPGHGIHPHVCLFIRDDNAQLIEASHEYFPDGFLPGAKLEHVSKDEPT